MISTVFKQNAPLKITLVYKRLKPTITELDRVTHMGPCGFTHYIMISLSELTFMVRTDVCIFMLSRK